MTDIFDLDGNVALVTGGGTGIGLAIATGLAERGARVVLAGRRREVIEASAAALRAAGRKADAMPLDVTDVAVIYDVVARIVAAHGRLDILVTSAGTNQRMPVLEMDPKTFGAIVDTNLKGPFFCMQAAAKAMVPRGRGKIVNIASLQSESAARNGVTYASTKGGLKMMTKGFAVELASAGIQVNAIGPGTFPTDLNKGLFADPNWVAAQRAKIPMGRVGKLDELVGAAVFLASPASNYVTGQIIYVDGGYLSALF
jgi:gluconate 5-dehydrogenase